MTLRDEEQEQQKNTVLIYLKQSQLALSRVS